MTAKIRGGGKFFLFGAVGTWKACAAGAGVSECNQFSKFCEILWAMLPPAPSRLPLQCLRGQGRILNSNLEKKNQPHRILLLIACCGARMFLLSACCESDIIGAKFQREVQL